MRILLVEPDSAVAQSIELMLRSEGFNVYSTDSGEEAVDLAKIYAYDLITLELNLPDMSGYEVLKQIRTAKVRTPVIVLSRSAGIEDKVKAFGVGADEYMTKPFHKDELVARIHAIVRRSKGHAQSIVSVGDIAVNISTKTATVRGKPLPLTGREYQMLELLALRKGVCVTKEQILTYIYNERDEPGIKIIDVFVCKLRRKLANLTDGAQFIETIWARGYMLRTESDQPEQSPSLAPEVRDLMDDPPTGLVSRKTFLEKRAEDVAAGKVRRPAAVPA